MKNIMVILLVFSLLWLSGSLFAEKKGAEIIIAKNDGRQVRGELIAVKTDSLLLMDSVTGDDVSINVSDIRDIKIMKKSKTLTGVVSGFFAGAAAGALAGLVVDEAIGKKDWIWGPEDSALLGGGIGGLVGALTGGMIGAHIDHFETFQIADRSDEEIKAILGDLHKKDRVPDYQ